MKPIELWFSTRHTLEIFCCFKHTPGLFQINQMNLYLKKTDLSLIMELFYENTRFSWASKWFLHFVQIPKNEYVE